MSDSDEPSTTGIPDWLQPGSDVFIHGRGIDFFSGPALPGRVTAVDESTLTVTAVTIYEDRLTEGGGRVTRTSEPREFRWESENWWRSHQGDEPYTEHFTLYHPQGSRAVEERLRAARKRIATTAKTVEQAHRLQLEAAVQELLDAVLNLRRAMADRGNGMP